MTGRHTSDHCPVGLLCIGYWSVPNTYAFLGTINYGIKLYHIFFIRTWLFQNMNVNLNLYKIQNIKYCWVIRGVLVSQFYSTHPSHVCMFFIRKGIVAYLHKLKTLLCIYALIINCGSNICWNSKRKINSMFIETRFYTMCRLGIWVINLYF